MSAKKNTSPIQKVEQLNGMVLSASADDLNKWLRDLPHPVARHWTHNSVPLIRCAALDRPDLFKRWMDWGCSTTGRYSEPERYSYRTSISLGTPIIEKIVDANPNALVWILEHSPDNWLSHISQLCSSGFGSEMSSLDWKKMITNPACSLHDRQQLALFNLISTSMFADPEMLLRASHGHLGAPNSKLDYHWSTSGMARTPTDDVLFKRLNKIETGLIQHANIDQLVKLGYWISVSVVAEHLQLNNPSYFDIHPSRSAPASWRDWVQKINASSYSDFTNAQLIAAWDTVANLCLDVRFVDRRNKDSILHGLLDIIKWPMDVRQHAAKACWEKKNILLHQKNAAGRTVAEAATGHSLSANLASYVVSLEAARHLDNVLAHQTNSAISKNHKKVEQEPVRRRRM